jgi:hypothetical protein
MIKKVCIPYKLIERYHFLKDFQLRRLVEGKDVLVGRHHTMKACRSTGKYTHVLELSIRGRFVVRLMVWPLYSQSFLWREEWESPIGSNIAHCSYLRNYIIMDFVLIGTECWTILAYFCYLLPWLRVSMYDRALYLSDGLQRLATAL